MRFRTLLRQMKF